MTRKTSNPPPPEKPTMLLVSHQDAQAKLKDRIQKGQELLACQVNSFDDLGVARNNYYKWRAYNEELLKQIFSTDRLAQEYSGSVGIAIIGGRSPTLREEIQELHQDINENIHRLESIGERLDLFPGPEPEPIPTTSVKARNAGSTPHKVFLVHGHDEAARETVARFLEKLGIEAVILHEQPSGGRTLIEKLEHHSDVDFSVVLLTPDDVGAKSTSADQLNPRARQNVVTELGFFVGKLGRSRVCAVHKGLVELPSDWLGVVYVPMDDSGGWRLLLAKELRESGFSIDLNAAL